MTRTRTGRLHVGIDVTSIGRWERAAGASDLAGRILSVSESRQRPARQAEAFAAKEAVLKALEAEMLQHDLRDVVVADGGDLVVGGALASRAADLRVDRWHHSSASAGDVAIAVVIGETIEVGPSNETVNQRKEQ